MRSATLVLCLLLTASGCSAAPAPTAGPSPVATPPAASPTTSGMTWEEYHSDNLFFSLQLPRGWQARRGGTSEGEVLRAEGGSDGTLLVTIDTPDPETAFAEYVRSTFRSLLESDPDAVQVLTLPGGRAARAVSPRADGGVSVIYLFAPRGDHAKLLSFTWGGAEPNPLWQAIAERFNAYSSRPIIPFITPAPSG